MKHEEIRSTSERETAKLAKLLAEEALKTKPGKQALVIGLTGELGAGKTTFAKSFLRALGVKGRVVSPTFIFSRRYSLARGPIPTVWHFDLYRLNSPKGMKEIGLRETLQDPRNIVLVEWADKIKKALPRRIIWVEFRHGAKPNERHLTFNRR